MRVTRAIHIVDAYRFFFLEYVLGDKAFPLGIASFVAIKQRDQLIARHPGNTDRGLVLRNGMCNQNVDFGFCQTSVFVIPLAKEP